MSEWDQFQKVGGSAVKDDWDQFPRVGATPAPTTPSSPAYDFGQPPATPYRTYSPIEQYRIANPQAPGATQRRFLSKRRQAEMGIIEADPATQSEKDGGYFDLPNDVIQSLAAGDEQKSRVSQQKQFVQDNFNYPTAFVAPYQAAIDFGNTFVVRPIDALTGGSTADEINRNMSSMETAADQLAGGSKIKQIGRMVTGSAMGMITPGGLAGAAGKALGYGAKAIRGAQTAASIGSAGLTTANSSFTEAKDAGKSTGEALKYAAIQGAIESGVATAFQLRGWGGAEKALFGDTAAKSFRELAGKTLKGLAQELPEELLTTVGQNINNNLSEVNPVALQNKDGSFWNKDGPSPFVNSLLDTFYVTAATMGLINTPRAIGLSKEATQKWMARNPEIAKAVDAIDTPKPTRGELEKAGLEGVSGLDENGKVLTTPDSRAQIRDNIRAELAEVEAASAEPGLPDAEVFSNATLTEGEFNQLLSTGRSADEILGMPPNQARQIIAQPEAQVPNAAAPQEATVPPTQPPAAAMPQQAQAAIGDLPPPVDPDPAGTARMQQTPPLAQQPTPTQPEPIPPRPTPTLDPEVQAEYEGLSGHKISAIVEPTAKHKEGVDFLNARRTRFAFFTSPSGAAANSFYHDKTKTIYINAEGDGDELWYTIGHEYAHASGADKRLNDLPESIINQAMHDYALGSAADYLKKLLKKRAQWRQEGVALHLGNILKNPKNRARVRNENPTAWKKIADDIRRLVGKLITPNLQRALDEFNTLPTEPAKPVAPPVAPVTPAAAPTQPRPSTPRESASTPYTDMANPIRGTKGGDAVQAEREDRGLNIKPKWTREEVVKAAREAVDANPQAVQDQLLKVARDGQIWTHEQFAQAEVLIARKGDYATTLEQVTELKKFIRIVDDQSSATASALRARGEDLFQTPEGRKTLLLRELMDDSDADTKRLEKAREYFKRQGGGDGLMLSDVQPGTLPKMEDNYRKPLSHYAPKLYREVNLSRLIEYLDVNTSSDMTGDDVFFANTENLALGQGNNKGAMIEFASSKIDGIVNSSKPSWQFAYDNGEAELVGRGNTQKTYRDSVRAVTIRKDATASKPDQIRLRLVLKRLENQGWTKRDNVDGSTTYSRTAEPDGDSGLMLSDVQPEKTKRPYENAPDSLMGFPKNQGMYQKGFDDQKYKYVQYVKVTFDDGSSHTDAIKGLNKPHAMERARRNWGGAKIEEATKAEYDAAVKAFDESGILLSDNQPEKQTNTPEFKKWFGNSKVVDENGDPMVVHHGTPFGNFDERAKGINAKRAEAIKRYNAAMGDSLAAFDLMNEEEKKYYAKYGQYRGARQQPGYIAASKMQDEASRQLDAARRDHPGPAEKEGEVFRYVQGVDRGYLGQGFYFTRPHKEAMNYAERPHRSPGPGEKRSPYVYAVYLSIQNPYRSGMPINAPIATQNGEVRLKNLGPRADIDERQRLEMEIWTDKLKESGYDGVIGDYGDGVEYVAFEPNQIKSATGNKGTFDPNNPSILLADAIDKSIDKNTPEDKAAVKAALKDDNVSRAVTALQRVEREIAKRKMEFRQRMERKGVLPSTPQGMAALVADPDAFFRVLREVRAWKNLGRGMGSKLTGGRVGASGLIDALYEASMSNILSSLKTASVNIAGTPINYLAHLVPRGLAATANVVTGSKTGPQLGEFKYLLKGLWQARGAAWSNASKSFWQETSMLDRESGRRGTALESLGGDYAIPGFAGRLIRAPGYGGNRFGDDLSRTFIANAEAAARAYRLAVESNVPRNQIDAYVQNLVSNNQSIVWQGDVEGAYEYANKMGFQEKGGAKRQAVVNWLSNGRDAVPGLRWFMRFVKFPVNAAVQTKEWTPIHFWHVIAEGADNIKNGREWSYGIKEDMAKAFVGTLAAIMMFDDLEDEERKGEFGLTRKGPRFGDTTIDVTRIEPLGSAYSILVDTAMSVKKNGFTSIPMAAMAALGDTIINKPTMRAVKDVVDFGNAFKQAREQNDPQILTDSMRDLAANQVTSFFPRVAEQFIDAGSDETGYARRNRQAAELFGLKTAKVAAQYDAWGNKKSLASFGNPVGDYLWRLFTPINITTQPQHPGDALIGRWNAKGEGKPFKLPEISPDYIEKGKKVRMPPEQFQRYVQLAGQVADSMFRTSGLDKKEPTEATMKSLDTLFEHARDAAKDIIKQETATGKVQPINSTELAPKVRDIWLGKLAYSATQAPPVQEKGEADSRFAERQKEYNDQAGRAARLLGEVKLPPEKWESLLEGEAERRGFSVRRVKAKKPTAYLERVRALERLTQPPSR